MRKFGLIGKTLGHSFSKKYYLEKFEKENIQDVGYDLYELSSIDQLVKLYESNPELLGINITIPYKEEAIPYVDELSDEAKAMQAINCVQIRRNGSTSYLKGYNTDAFGFEESFKKHLKPDHQKALILGYGGAAKAVKYVLEKLRIDYQIVSRSQSSNALSYQDLTKDILESHSIIINCSPVGTYPNVLECPNIPYEYITSKHYLYDLIYNPEETLFLKKGRENGACTTNGLEMLTLQAEKNWEIWNQ
jgi:shikimate dehydrogenase